MKKRSSSLVKGCLLGGLAAIVWLMTPGPVSAFSSGCLIDCGTLFDITSINPNAKNVGDPGFLMIVAGDGFSTSDIVRWNGANLPTPFYDTTTGNLQVNIPASLLLVAGVDTVTVYDGVSKTTNGVSFTVNNVPPNVTSLSPSSAIVGGAQFTLTINGTNFLSGAIVQWDGGNLNPSSVSPTAVTVTIPQTFIATTGNHSVTVTNPAPTTGPSNAQTFSVVNPAPTGSSLIPNAYTLGTTAPAKIQFMGSNIMSVATVTLDGSAVSATWINSGEIDVNLTYAQLNALSAGPHNITATNPGPGGGPATLVFTINNPPPTLTTINPTSALVGASQFFMQVNGTGFLNGASVYWNGSAQATSYSGNTQLVATITTADTAGPAGTIPITVKNPSSVVSNALNFSLNNGVPTLTSLSPSSVPMGSPDTTVTITGTGFASGAQAQWNGFNRPTTFLSATQVSMTALSADLASPGTANISVLNPNSAGPSNSLLFSITTTVPTITSLSPSTVVAGSAGFTLIVTGTNFVSGSTVNWNGSARSTVFVSANQVQASITAADVASPGSVNVTVVNPGNQTSNAAVFTVTNAAPTLTSLNPATMKAGSPAFTLVVNGAGLMNGAVVKWNGAALTTTPPINSGTQVSATVPASNLVSGGVFNITAANPSSPDSNALSFTVTSAPVLLSLTPNTIAAGSPDFNLLATGQNFDPTNAVIQWNGVNMVSTPLGAQQVQATIPSGLVASAGTFPVAVVNPPNTGGTSNTLNFTVTASSGGGGGNPMAVQAVPNPVAGLNTTLSVLNMDNNSSVAKYVWSASPTGPTFSDNNDLSSHITMATFTKIGVYNIQAVAQDSGGNQIASAGVMVTVNPTLTSIIVTPAAPQIHVGGQQLFTATPYDQFNNVISPAPGFFWQVSCGGTINQAGLFTAGPTPCGPLTVSASANGVTGTAAPTLIP